MSFAHPQCFWALALLPVLLALFIGNEARRAKLLRQLVAARLQDRLAGTVSVGKRRARFALLLLGAALVIVSLARPQFGYTWQESQRKGRDVLLAIDVSKSMLANDTAPSRLARAKLAAQDLIQQLGGDRVGLIAFAGSAFLQAPLTVDYGAVLASLNELDPEIIPLGGSNLAETIRAAVEAFGKGESDNRALIIFSDGEELDTDGVKAAEKQKDAARIFGVGVGTTEGALIPLAGAAGGTEFVKDASGQFVKTRLDETRLRAIAEATGGFYVHLLSGPAEMTQIVRDGLGKMTEKDIDAKMSRQPIERYQWPLAGGLVLLAGSMLLGERRRVRRAAAVAACFGLLSGPVDAAQESPKELYAAGRYEDAQKAFEQRVQQHSQSPALAFNWGAAAYKNNDFDTALKAFSEALTADDAKLRAKAEYNLANTLLQKGAPKLEEKPLRDALAHYDQALKLEPDNADAQHNRKFTEELLAKLKQQQQQQQQDKKQDQKKEQQQKQDQKDQPQQGDQTDQQQQGGEQKKDDQQSQGGDSKQEKKEGEQSKDQQGKDGEKKPEDSGQQKEAKNGKEGDQKEPQEQEAMNRPQDGKDKKDGKGQQQPQPVPEQPGKKPEGELKANPSQPQQNGEPQDSQAEAAAEEAAAAEGRMTERQAAALLESLRNEDDRVRLIDPNERKRAGRVLRDW